MRSSSTAFWQAALVVAGAACIALALSSLDGDWVTRADQRAVRIATLPCDSVVTSTSSGFVVDDETVVSVAHAIYGTRDFAMRDVFGTWHRGELIAFDVERDLAVVHVAGLRATSMERSPRRRTDDWREVPVRLLGGSATGFVDAVLRRRIAVITDHVGDRSQQSRRSGYEVELDIGAGDSGAALIDGQDRLVAIVFARSKGRPTISWATAVEELSTDPSPIPSWECRPDFGVELELRP